MCISRLGIGTREAIADTTIGSVGDTIVASEGDGERQRRDHLADKVSDTDDREHHKADC
jgi:hypothetical protein